MSSGTEQRKLAAIMFTDMVGYSALPSATTSSRSSNVLFVPSLATKE